MSLLMERLRDFFQIHNWLIRNIISEFIGSITLNMIGISVTMQFVLSKINSVIQVNLGWGLAVTFSIYLCAHTSGGHLNPAVSFAMFSIGQLKFSTFVLYSIAQVLGAMVGAAVAYMLYFEQFEHFSGSQRAFTGPKGTAGCFTSYPPAHLSHCAALMDQIIGTGVLVFFICMITDKRNKIISCLQPLLIGLVVVMIGTSFALNLGSPINPARDFGPRLFSFFIYGLDVFSAYNYYWWIPIIGPLIGGPLASWIYYIFIGIHIPDNKCSKLIEERISLNNSRKRSIDL